MSIAEHELTATWIPDRDPVRRFVDDLEAVKYGGLVMLFCAEARPELYSDKHVVEAIRRAVGDRKAIVRVMTGPFLLTNQESHGIWHLHQEGVLTELLHRRFRGAEAQFRLVETDAGYRYTAEMPHSLLQPPERRRFLNTDALAPREIQALVQDGQRTFESWAARLRTGKTADLPVLVSPEGLSTLMQEAEELGKDFTFLPIEGIQALPSAGKALWAPPKS